MAPGRRQNALLAVVGITGLAVIAAALWLPGRADPDLAQRLPSSSADGAPRPNPNLPNADPSARDDPAATAASPAGDVALRVRLRGLHADVPWTAPLRLTATDVERSVAAEVRIDDAGLATFALPAWCRKAAYWFLTAEDPNYRKLALTWQDVETDEERLIDVTALALFTGRVVDTRGTPIASAVVALFDVQNDAPGGPSLASRTSAEDGTFVVEAPHEQPVVVIAHDGGGAHLQPAHVRTAGHIGAPTHLPDLVLDDGALVEGTMLWSDGTPVTDAVVRAGRQDGARLGADVFWFADDRVGQAIARTDDRGQFCLAMPKGAAVDVELVQIERHRLFGTLQAHVVAPRRLVWTVPKPVGAHATVDGAAVRRDWYLAFADGTIGRRTPLVLLAGPVALRAIGKLGLRSSWREIGPALAGTEIELPMSRAATEVALAFAPPTAIDDIRVTAVDSWGRTSDLPFVREDGMRLFLDPGRHHLSFTMRQSNEAEAGQPLVHECDIEVGTSAMHLTVPLASGGSLVVMATDAHGRHIAGSCAIAAGSGPVRPLWFLAGEPGVARAPHAGELLPGPSQLEGALPAGDHELLFDLVGHGPRRARVTIRTHENTVVHVRP